MLAYVCIHSYYKDVYLPVHMYTLYTHSRKRRAKGREAVRELLGSSICCSGWGDIRVFQSSSG